MQDCYRKLFEIERGVGYPKERAEIMATNRNIFSEVKAAATQDMLTVLKSVDQTLLKSAIAGKNFEELFFANATDKALISYVKELLAA